MKSIQIDFADLGVQPEMVAKLARTAVSHQQQRVARCATRVPIHDNLAPVLRYIRIARPSLVRLILTLACALAE
jgi:hypothetical protein